MKVAMASRIWPMREPFVVSRGGLTQLSTLHLRLTDARGAVGRSEACGVLYAGETPERMMTQIQAIIPTIEAGVDRETLLEILPPGGARLALDSALWDLEAKSGGKDPFQSAGVTPSPVQSAETIGIRSLGEYETAGGSAFQL